MRYDHFTICSEGPVSFTVTGDLTKALLGYRCENGSGRTVWEEVRPLKKDDRERLLALLESGTYKPGRLSVPEAECRQSLLVSGPGGEERIGDIRTCPQAEKLVRYVTVRCLNDDFAA